MARLFLAIQPPLDICQQLLALRRIESPLLRYTAIDNLHITLHFLGSQSERQVVEALEGLRFRTFELKLGDMGQFIVGRGRVLWVGVRSCEALLDLQRKIGALLKGSGLIVEDHTYKPHITLARCRKSTPTELLDQLLLQHLPSVGFDVTQFALFDSHSSEQGVAYTPLCWFHASP